MQSKYFGADYARTLLEWRKRFRAAWPRISALGYTEQFHRLWDYYLCYCAAGFKAGTIDVGLYVLERPADPVRTRWETAALISTLPGN